MNVMIKPIATAMISLVLLTSCGGTQNDTGSTDSTRAKTYGQRNYGGRGNSNYSSMKDNGANPSTNAPTTPYSQEDVAKHNTAPDCWVTIFDKVYNVTTWENRHPGGSQAIIQSCGKDITAYSESHPGGKFNGPKLDRILQGFEVGILKK